MVKIHCHIVNYDTVGVGVCVGVGVFVGVGDGVGVGVDVGQMLEPVAQDDA